MADTYELADAICNLIAATDEPVLMTLMNHDANSAAEVIGAIVERCEAEGVALRGVCIDPHLANELGLSSGALLPHGTRPVIHVEPGLGRQLRFLRR